MSHNSQGHSTQRLAIFHVLIIIEKLIVSIHQESASAAVIIFIVHAWF